MVIDTFIQNLIRSLVQRNIFKKFDHKCVYLDYSHRCRKWTRRSQFKYWMRLFAFHIALIPLGKCIVIIPLGGWLLYLSFLKPLMAIRSDNLVVSLISDQGYYTFVYGHTKDNWEGERKEQTNKQTNTGLG